MATVIKAPKAEVGSWLMMSARSQCRQHWTDDTILDDKVVQHKGVMPVLNDSLRRRFVYLLYSKMFLSKNE
mgnify:CR=1 FL=1